MQVNATGEGGEQRSFTCLHFLKKIVNVGARFNHQGAAQFSVEGMFDEDVENSYAMVYQDLQFLGGVFGTVAAGKNRAVCVAGNLGQAITLRRGDDLFTAGPQYGDVLDHALAADAEVLCQFLTGDGTVVGAHPIEHAAPAGG